ncbi:MAG: hypothetical protein IPM18_17700 [Phycisphaerales bacterium]|nr:hypothetical protein [Phycisphaerales bacterium]
MNRIDALYDWLAIEPSSAADRVLGAALEFAEPHYQQRLCDLLLQRGRSTSWAALIANYGQLPATLQKQVRDAGPVLAEAAGLALRGNTRAQQNALELLREHPLPQVAYLVADTLRSPAEPVHAAAASVLRLAAEDEIAAGITFGRKPLPDMPSQERRAHIVDALREALRTFALHHRVDVLEPCLWFAPELGEALWATLEAGRSPAAYVVTKRLPTWDDPRLAPFLLLALRRPTWRQAALDVLQTWSTRTHLLAMLACTYLLDESGICKTLSLLKHPRWLFAGGPALADLPREARALVPRWVTVLGFTDDERVVVLSRWLGIDDPEIRRAAAYALAQLETDGAVQTLGQLAVMPGPLRTFARWYVTGRQVRALGTRRRTAGVSS